MDIMMIDFQCALKSKIKRKLQLHWQHIYIYFFLKKTSHLCIKSANVKANTSMHITHDNEWGMGEVAKRLGSHLFMHKS